MKSTALPPLLAAPPVSRATFFAQLLVEPRPQSEMLFDDSTTDSTAESPAPPEDPAQPSAIGFPA